MPCGTHGFPDAGSWKYPSFILMNASKADADAATNRNSAITAELRQDGRGRGAQGIERSPFMTASRDFFRNNLGRHILDASLIPAWDRSRAYPPQHGGESECNH